MMQSTDFVKKINETLAINYDLEDIQGLNKTEKSKIIRGFWTKEEDEKVTRLVELYGPKKWAFIAQHLEGRIGKQCRERWINHLRPNIIKTEFSEEEDRIICEAHEALGNKWAQIAKLLPGRSDNSIKNRWNSKLRKNINCKSTNDQYLENHLNENIVIQLNNDDFISAKIEKPDFLLKETVNRKRKACNYMEEMISSKIQKPIKTELISNTGNLVFPSSSVIAIAYPTEKETAHAEPLVYYDKYFKSFPQKLKSNQNMNVMKGEIIIDGKTSKTINNFPKIVHDQNEKKIISIQRNPTQYCSSIRQSSPFQNSNPSINLPDLSTEKDIVLIPESLCLELSKSGLNSTNFPNNTNANEKTNQDVFNSILNRNITPLKLRQNIIRTPKTPTPLKYELLKVERERHKKYNNPMTPTLLQDIEEYIIEKEQSRPNLNRENIRPKNGIRKSLASSWTDLKETTHSFSEDNEDGVMKLNPSPTKNQNNESDREEINNIYQSIFKLMYEKWSLIAGGRTNDQIILTELAYKLINLNKT